MKQRKSDKTVTLSIRLKPEEHALLRRLSRLKNRTQTSCLTEIAKKNAREELLSFAVNEYVAGRWSLSEAATKTGLDMPGVMDAVARFKSEDRSALEGFLSAARSLAKAHKDPGLYELAMRALSK